MIGKVSSLLASILLSVGLPLYNATADEKPKFSPGQIWAYKNRPKDIGSLIKIYRIETLKHDEYQMVVYHISMVGVSLGDRAIERQIGHLPVSKETLDKSVTKLVESEKEFLDITAIDEGIAIWRKDEGGVFTISLAEIADVLERTLQSTQ